MNIIFSPLTAKRAYGPVLHCLLRHSLRSRHHATNTTGKARFRGNRGCRSHLSALHARAALAIGALPTTRSTSCSSATRRPIRRTWTPSRPPVRPAQHSPSLPTFATAEVLVQGLRRGDLDWRDIVNPKKNKNTYNFSEEWIAGSGQYPFSIQGGFPHGPDPTAHALRLHGASAGRPEEKCSASWRRCARATLSTASSPLDTPVIESADALRQGRRRD